MKKITTIAVRNRGAINDEDLFKKTRVCAYCRVSTDSLKQADSFEMQTSYYEDYIKEKKEWEFAGVYADQGITGTRKDKRVEFNKMIKDCELRKIDMIITKSISRFARNTADCLEVVRYLKSKNVAVYFQRENINTLGADSELILSVLSSIAQDESRNISENTKWAFQKKFKEGRIQINTKRFLGYDIDDNGKLVINPSEAKIVKRIYKEYLKGKSFNEIKRGLEKDKIKTAMGNSIWHGSTIRRILVNEKYCGDLILQKTITIDFLTKKRVTNKGEMPKYKVEGNHKAIISKEDFLEVQALLNKKAAKFGNLPKDRNKYSQKYVFSGKIKCGSCGAVFKRRTWNSKVKTKQIVWQCSTYINEGKSSCDMKAIDNNTIKTVFVRMFNKIYEGKDDFYKIISDNIEKVLKQNTRSEEIFKIEREITIINEELKGLVRQQIKGQLKEGDFDLKYKILNESLMQLKNNKDKISYDKDKYKEFLERSKEIQKILEIRENTLNEFDDYIFENLIEKILVITPTHLEFYFKNGMKVEEKFIKKKGVNGLQ